MASGRLIIIDPVNMVEEQRALLKDMLNQNAGERLFICEQEYNVCSEGTSFRVKVTKPILRTINAHSHDRYQVLSIAREDELGSGCYGTVSRVLNTLRLRKDDTIRETEKSRVVKTSNICAGSSGQRLKFFADNEALISRRIPYLHAKNSVQAGGKQYLVMRRLPGVNLEALYLEWRDGLRPLPLLDRQLRLSINMTKAVLELHQLGIKHRDIKLGNMLLDEQTDAIKLIDFGFSQLTTEEDSFRGGSLLYVAPEIYDDEVITEKADIFALGICLRFLWGGKEPHASVSPEQLLSSRLNHNELVVLQKDALLAWPMSNVHHEALFQLLNELVAFNPKGRPDLEAVISTFEDIQAYTVSENQEQCDVVREAYRLGNGINKLSSLVELSLGCFLINVEMAINEAVLSLDASPLALRAFNSCHQIALLRQVKTKEEIMPLVIEVIHAFKDHHEAILLALEQSKLTDDQTDDLLAMLRKFNRPGLTLDDMASINGKAQHLLDTLTSSTNLLIKKRG